MTSAQPDDLMNAVADRLRATAAITSLGSTGVWPKTTPPGKAKPYIVVGFQGGRDSYTVNAAHAYSDVQILVKAVDEGYDYTRTMNLARAIDTALNGVALTLANGSLLLLTRASPVLYDETDGDTMYWHAGGLYDALIA